MASPPASHSSPGSVKRPCPLAPLDQKLRRNFSAHHPQATAAARFYQKGWRAAKGFCGREKEAALQLRLNRGGKQNILAASSRRVRGAWELERTIEEMLAQKP